MPKASGKTDRMKAAIVIIFFDMGLAWAAGGSGSALDLKWPFLNLFLLGILLVWKIKKPLSEMFRQNASDIKYLYNVAQEKEKESSMKYEMYKKKMDDVSKDYNAVLEKFQQKGIDFVAEQGKEGDIFIAKLKKEKEQKIEVEKNKMLKKMESILLYKIILKTKKKIEADIKLKGKVTKGLISKIG